MDSGGAETNLYIPDGTCPESILIDERGVIRYIQEGAATMSPSLLLHIEELLGP